MTEQNNSIIAEYLDADSKKWQRGGLSQEKLDELKGQVWETIKNQIVHDVKVVLKKNADKPTRTYTHIYVTVFAVIDSGLVKVRNEIYKGAKEVRHIEKMGEAEIGKFYNQYFNKPLNEFIDRYYFMEYSNLGRGRYYHEQNGQIVCQLGCSS